MIFAVELLLEAFLGYKVFTESDRTKLFMWFMTAMIMLFPGLKLMPGIPAVNWMFPVICLARVIKDGNLKSNWSNFPLKYIYALILIFHFVQPVFVQWQELGSTYFYVIQYVMITYFYLFLGFCMAPDYKKLMKYKNWVYALLIALFVIAVISKLITYNFISSSLSDSNIWTSDRANTERGFRVTATQGSPNIFGFICVFFAILIMNYRDSFAKKAAFMVIILINILLCATRAPMFGLIAALCIYALFIKTSKVIKTALITLCAGIFFVNIVGVNDSISQYVSGVADIIMTGGENTGGSSVDLRNRQLAMATAYAVENPIWGKGHGFCSAIQRENTLLHALYYKNDLAGAESLLFYTLIDYGFIYTGLVLIYFTVLFYNYFKNYRRNKHIVMIAVPMAVALLVHLITSRPDNSWQIFMPIMGACLYMIKKNNRELPRELIYE